MLCSSCKCGIAQLFVSQVKAGNIVMTIEELPWSRSTLRRRAALSHRPSRRLRVRGYRRPQTVKLWHAHTHQPDGGSVARANEGETAAHPRPSSRPPHRAEWTEHGWQRSRAAGVVLARSRIQNCAGGRLEQCGRHPSRLFTARQRSSHRRSNAAATSRP